MRELSIQEKNERLSETHMRIPVYKLEIVISDPNDYDYSLEDIIEHIDQCLDTTSMTHMLTVLKKKKTYAYYQEEEFEESKLNNTTSTSSEIIAELLEKGADV